MPEAASLLGVKWSSVAASALPLVDVVEVNGWGLDAPRPALPTLLHNLDLDFSLTRPGILTEEWAARVNTAIARSGSPWFSLHLGFSAAEVRFTDHMLPASALLDRDTCLERVVAVARFLGARLAVPLLLENLDYCPEGAYEHVCRPDFIADAVRAGGCGLLLDLAHLQVSADWLGYDPRDYAERLPLDRVVELHLSGPRRLGERLDDAHRELTPADEAFLDWALRRCRPRAVVLEYDRDAGRLQEQLTRLHAIIERVGADVGVQARGLLPS